MSKTSEYQKTLVKLKAEAAELIRQRQKIDTRLANLKQAMDGLDAVIQQRGRPRSGESVAGIEGQSSLGLSDSIREILRIAGTPLSPTEIRDRLVREMHFKPGQYANFLAVIHSTIRRLVMSKDVGFAEFAGRTVYLHNPRAETPRTPAREGRARSRRTDVHE
jgi:hypothetical protein